MVVVYGISNCDTVRKARAWLAAERLESRFYDFRRDGLPEAVLVGWIREVGLEVLINRQGTTWRGLSEADRVLAVDARTAARLLSLHPTLIKRPVVEWSDGLSVGFDAGAWAHRIQAGTAGR